MVTVCVATRYVVLLGLSSVEEVGVGATSILFRNYSKKEILRIYISSQQDPVRTEGCANNMINYLCSDAYGYTGSLFGSNTIFSSKQ